MEAGQPPPGQLPTNSVPAQVAALDALDGIPAPLVAPPAARTQPSEPQQPGVSHLDEIAASLKVPEGEMAQAAALAHARQMQHLRKGRSGGNLEDEATAAQLLLGIGTFSDSAGSGDTHSAGRTTATAPPAEPATTHAGNIRRSQRRSAAARNPAVAAALAADESGDEEDEEEMPPSIRRPPSAPRGRAAVAVTAVAAAAPHAAPHADSPPPFLPPPLAATTTIPAPAQKSELTLLCERFQTQFGHLHPDGSATMLMLNDVAEALGVPRRRLYDVINVFESIEVMKRVGKLMYEFCGYDHLPALLQQMAADEEAGIPVEDRIRRAPILHGAEGGAEEPAGSRANSHSLWVLSRRLVRMLLKSQGPIALTSAAAVLVGPHGVNDPSKHRSQTQITVERRLYDIGSILCSLGLVERVYMKKRQPAFEWVYGWRPGDSRAPPELAVAAASRLPAPPLALLPRRMEEAGGRGGRRGGRPAGGGGNKRQRVDPNASMAATTGMGMGMGMGGMQLPFGMFPGMMPQMMGGPGGAPGAGGMPNAAMMAAMAGGMGMMPDGTGAGALVEGKPAPGGMPFFNPGFFSPMAMQMAAAGGMGMTPMLPDGGMGGGAEGEGAGGAGGPPMVSMSEAMAAAGPGMMMWPGMASMMMHPAAMMQMQQQQQQMQMQMQPGQLEGQPRALGEGETAEDAAAAAAAAAAAGQFHPMFGMPTPWGSMMPGMAPMVPVAGAPPPPP